MTKAAVCVAGLLGLCFGFISCGGSGSTGGSSRPPSNFSQVPRSAIRHLMIVVLQNSSFDHLFGTYAGVNGLDSSLASYHQKNKAGTIVSPFLLTDLSPNDLNHTATSYQIAYDSGKMDKYAWENGDLAMGYYDTSSIGAAADGQQYGVGTLWSYAQQYALADNYFASAMASEPSNMLYMIAANPGTGSEPYGYPQLDSCSAALYQQNQASGATITSPLTFQNVGDQLSSAGISWGFYQEFFTNQQNGTCAHYVPQENPFQYFQTTANSAHVQDFSMSAFNSMLSSGNLPAVMWIQPSPSHSMHPGQGSIATGVEWLDNFVQAVKSSDVWNSTAIVVLWDESGGWYDHVAPAPLTGTLGLGARVPVILISPFAKTGHVSSQQMDHVSLLRFIQWNWALGPLSGASGTREAQSANICDLLTSDCGNP